MSAGFRANVSLTSSTITLRSSSSSAASTPTYAMFFIRIRVRAFVKRSLHMRASGTPMISMSRRDKQTVARPSRVVDQRAAGRDLLQVARVGLRVHRDHDVDGTRSARDSRPC